MGSIEGVGVKDRWRVPGIGVGRWYIIDSSSGKVAINLPRETVGANVKNVKVKIEWEE